MVVTEWSYLTGEWVLRSFVRGSYSGGYVRRAVVTLSPSGPPFRYRSWDREAKNWVRSTLDHATTIEEAKACLQIALRIA